MKKKSKIIIFLWALLILIPIGAYFIKQNIKEEPGIVYNKNINIEKYNIDLNVKETGTIDVLETLEVNINKNIDNIVKVFPKWMEYKDKNNKNKTRKIVISDMHVTGDQFYLTEKNNSYNLEIGNKNGQINSGNHIYTIKYTLDMGKDLNKGFDELVYNAFEQKNFKVKEATMTITMPKEINNKNVKIDNKNVKYTTKNKTITLKAVNEISSSVVITIDLPDNYFKNTNNNYGVSSLLVMIATIIASIVILAVWLTNRKKYKNKNNEIKNTPVTEYDPAELGYICGEQDTNKLATSLIVSLAYKGYIHIEKQKNKYILTNIADNYDINGLNIRVIEVTKQKNIDNNLTKNEKDYLDKLFFKNNLYITREFDSFYKEASSLIKKGYITLTDTDRTLDEELINNIKEDKNPYNTLSTLETLMYNYLFNDKNIVDLSKEDLTEQVNNIKEILDINIVPSIKKDKNYSIVKNSMIISIVLIILWIVAYLYIFDMNPQLDILYYISYALLFISNLILIIIERQLPYGEEIISNTNNFKKYLEQKQFTKETEENPNYLYNIIPYAYVLNMIDNIDSASEFLKDESFKILN